MLLIAALNARYYHTGLAARLLCNSCKSHGLDTFILERSINDPTDIIVEEIIEKNADIVGFSCYIWNIEKVMEVSALIKLIRPDIRIILGGPEVSFDPEYYLKTIPQAEAVLMGEGEDILPSYVLGRRDMVGMAYRDENGITVNHGQAIYEGFASAPFPYTADELLDKAKIFYLETSRGCPFSCAYCLSGREGKVRYRDIKTALSDIDRFIDAGVPLIKYIDRTFNCDENRARQIYSHILSKNGKTKHHFEICGHLITDETIELLSSAPQGLFRFEIGIQTTDPHALDAIGRRTNLEKLFENVKKLKEKTKVELHLDLIAGLPGETFSDIRKSFDDVYKLNADMLQLGFLKMLRGSSVRSMAESYGYAFEPKAPYEVIKNNSLSYEQLRDIKLVESCLDKMINSGSAPVSMNFLIGTSSPFDTLLSLGRLWKAQGKNALSREGTMRLIYSFGQENGYDTYVLKELLRYDYLKKDRNLGAKWLRNEHNADQKKKLHDAVKEAGGSAYGDIFLIDMKEYLESGRIVKKESIFIFC